MKKKAQNFLGFVFAVVGAVLAASGCDNGTDPVSVTTVTDDDGKVIGEIVKRTVPALKILKATDTYVLVGFEVPKNQDIDTGYKLGGSGNSSDLTGFTTTSFIDYTDDPSDGEGVKTTYKAQKVDFPGGEVSVTFVGEYYRSVDANTGYPDGVTTQPKDTKVSLSVKKSDFLTKASAIPNVAAADVTVYSGKSGVSGTTYDPALVNGANEYRIEVKLPDNLTQVQYLRVRANYTGEFPAADSSRTLDFATTSTSSTANKTTANRISSGFSTTSNGSISVNTLTSDGYVGTVSSTTSKGFDTYAVFKFTVAARQSDAYKSNVDGTRTYYHDWAPVLLDLKFATVSGTDKTTTSATAYTVNLSGYSTNTGFSVVR